MNVEKVLEAEFEAKRFLKKLNELKKNDPEPFKKDTKQRWFYTSKESGALKRSSMDLTRSLAELRKSY